MPDANTALRRTTWWLFGLAVLFVVVWQAPAFYTAQDLAGYLPLHMFAETFSIVVSMMVFGIAWNIHSKERQDNYVILACALLAVGLIDFAHMLSFKGMPDFITPSGPEKAINLWLSARLIAALALLAVSIRSWHPSHNPRIRYYLLAISLVVAAGVIWPGLANPQAWPHTFIEGIGLTPFKIGAEYGIIAILLVPAIRFYRQSGRRQSYDAVSLFAATVITILSELSFTLYSDVADIFNLLGHLYKIVAYIFIYRAVFVSSVREPFQRLDAELTENMRITKQLLDSAAVRTQLAAIVEFSNDAIIGKTPDGIITSWNNGAERIYGYSADEIIGRHITTLALPDQHAEMRQFLEKIRNGETVIKHGAERIRKDGSHIYVSLTLSPIRDTSGHINGISTIARDITERKAAEARLRRSEHGLAEAQRIAHLGSWELDLASNALTWSDEIYRIFEIDPEKFGATYEAFLNAIHPDDRAMVNTAYTDSVKNKVPYDIEHRLLMQDGRIKYVNEKCETYFGTDGTPLRSVGTVHDITARKLDEEALLRLNRELHAISNCNQILMRAENEQALLDDICRIVCADAGYRMAWVGYPENDADKTIRVVAFAGVEEGYLAQARITWADTERGRGPSGIAIRSGNSVCFQDFSSDPNAAPWRDAALQRGYRSSISMPLKDNNANTFGILTIYSGEPNAFTPEEIRLLEELAGDMAFGIEVLRVRVERKRVEESLRLMNERYELSTRAARMGVWDWNLQKNELVWDERMYELYGVKREDFASAYEAWLQGIHPDDRVASDEISQQAQRGEREYDTEFRVVWPDGSIHYLKAYGQFVRDAEGEPLRMTGVNFDITRRRCAEEEVRKLNRELEQRVVYRTAQLEAANKELESFSYSVSHDLRTPLRAIDGFSHILLEEYATTLDDEGKRLLTVVRENTERMGQLIDDILKFSRAGRLEVNFARIDMEKMAQDVFNELASSVAGSGLQLEIEPIPPAMGDSAMMHQVFVNLLSNAIKFSRTQETPRIQVGATIAGNETIYFVKDNGVGFDMQYADKLYGVFQRLHGTFEFEGTGIGLAIVKRIITRHGGRVWAEGKVDEGATFYFLLPQLEHAEADHAS